VLSPAPQVKEKMSKKVDVYEEGDKLPDFLVALRSHTVWEKTPVKLFCTVHGHPRPIVQWSAGLRPNRVLPPSTGF